MASYSWMGHALFALAVGGWIVTSVAAQDAPGPVVVELRARATVSARTVTLGDVADLRGGSNVLRDRLARMDLAEFPSPAAPVIVKRTQVEFRLQLADVPPSLFRLTGANTVTATPERRTIPEDRLVAAARDALLRRLPWSAEDVQIRPLQATTIPLPTAADPDDIHIAAEPHSPGVVTGRVQMDVTVYVRGERRLTVPVQLEVKPLQKVAICRQRVEKGEALSEANVFIERRPVESGPTAVPADVVVGRRVKRTLMPGQVVIATDVEESLGDGVAAVRARQIVKMVVHLGPVDVVANGEAQQDGKVGQTIRVLNLDSKKLVTGRVSGPGTVEVHFGGVP